MLTRSAWLAFYWSSCRFFIALFQVIQIFTTRRAEIEQFTYEFLKQFEPIKEVLANPASFNEKLFGIVDLTQSAFHNGQINFFLLLLAVVAGITQYIMSKQTMPQTESKRRIRDIMAEAADGRPINRDERYRYAAYEQSAAVLHVLYHD